MYISTGTITLHWLYSLKCLKEKLKDFKQTP